MFATLPGMGVGVGVPGVGVKVAVGQGPSHGSTVTIPFSSVLIGINAPETLNSSDSSRLTGVVPGVMATKKNRVMTPLPLGPSGSSPNVAHASVTVPLPIELTGQLTVRPVLARNGPSCTATKSSTAGSKVMLISYAPRSTTFSARTSTTTCSDELTV